jgi:surface antigen
LALLMQAVGRAMVNVWRGHRRCIPEIDMMSIRERSEGYMLRVKTRWMSSVLLVAIGLGSVTGCETNAGTGALIGAGAGAGLGAIIGNQSHGRAGSGALIGAGVGALGGALIGNEMDKSQRRAEQRAGDETYYRGNTYAASTRVAPDDVIAWSRRGMHDSEIIDRIDRSGTIFHLNAADEMRLRDAGVSEDVIREMRETSRR